MAQLTLQQIERSNYHMFRVELSRGGTHTYSDKITSALQQACRPTWQQYHFTWGDFYPRLAMMNVAGCSSICPYLRARVPPHASLVEHVWAHVAPLWNPRKMYIHYTRFLIHIADTLTLPPVQIFIQLDSSLLIYVQHFNSRGLSCMQPSARAPIAMCRSWSWTILRKHAVTFTTETSKCSSLETKLARSG